MPKAVADAAGASSALKVKPTVWRSQAPYVGPEGGGRCAVSGPLWDIQD
jgi:hypothetical protein